MYFYKYIYLPFAQKEKNNIFKINNNESTKTRR
nr:MAG TPA: hypothetical protein [Caudoviricetes sp.]